MSNSNRKFITVAKALRISQTSEKSILQTSSDKTNIEINSESENKTLSEIEIAFLPQLPAYVLQSGYL